MTREQAHREARKRWGKDAYARANVESSSPEKREAGRTERETLKARREAIDKEIDDRLKATDWYVALKAERAQIVKRMQHTYGSYYKFAVGHLSLGGLAYCIEGEGDTWEEAFAKADAKRADEDAKRKARKATA